MEEKNKSNKIDFENITVKEYLNQRFGVFKNFKLPKKSGLAKKLGFTKKFCIFLAFLFTFTAGSFVTLVAYKHLSPSASSKLDYINALVRKNYTGKIDDKVLDDALANAYMENINDKYAFYKDNNEGTLVEQSLEGTTTGIGVTILNDVENKTLTVIRVDEDSPAHKAGIKKGDKITAIDDKLIKEMSFKESVNSIKRKIGEKANLTVLRDKKTLNLTVIYEDYIRQSVYYEVVEDFGLLTITDFNDNTLQQFKKAYKYLVEQKVKGLIFDVRDNGGGTVDSVCEVLDPLVGECDLITIVYTDGEKSVAENAKSDADKCPLPMTVLINEETASAAELFAANLRDMAKAPLIGKNTYGKGVVQRTYFFGDGSCIRFTVGEFIPAGGKGFDGKGLAPDYEINLTEEQAANRYQFGAEDPCLNKAIEQLNQIVAKEK